jgi:hypothetical protein
VSKRKRMKCTVCGTAIDRGLTCSPRCKQRLYRRRHTDSKASRIAAGGTGTLPFSDLASKSVTVSKLNTEFAPFSACAGCGLATKIPLPTPDLCLPNGDPGEWDYPTPAYHAACAPDDGLDHGWPRPKRTK